MNGWPDVSGGIRRSNGDNKMVGVRNDVVPLGKIVISLRK